MHIKGGMEMTKSEKVKQLRQELTLARKEARIERRDERFRAREERKLARLERRLYRGMNVTQLIEMVPENEVDKTKEEIRSTAKSEDIIDCEVVDVKTSCSTKLLPIVVESKSSDDESGRKKPSTAFRSYSKFRTV